MIKPLVAMVLYLLLNTIAYANPMEDWLIKQFTGTPKDYGAWLCSSCNFPRTGGSFPTMIVDAEMKAFIEGNNDAIHSDE